MEYIVVTIIGFILGIYYSSSGKSKLDVNLMSNLKAGRRVIVVIDNEATIFTMRGNNIHIFKADVDLNFDDIGAQNESDNMGDGGNIQSGNYNESGLAD